MSRRKSYIDDENETELTSYPHEVGASADSKVDWKQNSKNGGHRVSVTAEDLHELVGQVGEAQVAPENDLALVIDKVDLLTVEDARQILVDLLEEHKWDYNFASSQRTKISKLLEGPGQEESTEAWALQLKSEAAICKYYSPYPEVRSVTTPDDDPNMPCETIRAHLLGYAWACIGQFVNSLFNSRFPGISISSPVAQVLLYPCGKLCAWILPDIGFTYKGQRISLNPGPWTYKEQMLSTIIVDVSLTSAYVFWNIQTQTIYYGDTWLTGGYKIALLLSTQLMGLGFAGVLRRFVVYPVQTFWPSILPTLALNRALLAPEKKEILHGWKISRYNFFFIVFVAMSVYFWLPDVIWEGISYFNWITWIAPNNFNLAMVTGSINGMGFNPIPTFDYNYTSVYMYPLTWPFFSYFQQYIGQMIASVAVLILYYNNVKWTSFLPINSNGIFDNTGVKYNISRVLGADTQLDEAAYKKYSPAFYTAGNLVLYGSFFAFYPFTMVFVILDQWRPISRSYRAAASGAWLQIKRTASGIAKAFGSFSKGQIKEGFMHLTHSLEDPTSVYDGFDDPFTNMMRNYAEVPDWWFLCIILFAFVLSIIILSQFQLGTPVWTIFFVIGLNIVFLVPMTYLYAVSGTTEGLNVVTELIIGYALPGNPEALMFVKAFGYNINGQADNYISDQKMGFYSKIPPRAMFRGQLISAVITCFVAWGVVDFADNIPGICTPGQAARFTCAGGSLTYFSSSVVWGLIGPKRIFSQIYPLMKYAFLVGFLLAIVWWTIKMYGRNIRAAARNSLPSAIFGILDMGLFYPISWLEHVHPSLIINGMLQLAPVNLSYTTMGVYLSFFFMYYIKRAKTSWFEKYLYVLSAALTAAIAFMGIIIFFAVQYHPVGIDWWGNDVPFAGVDGGADGTQQTRFSLADGQTFGPTTWN